MLFIISQCDYSLYGYRTVSDSSTHLVGCEHSLLVSPLCVFLLQASGYPIMGPSTLFFLRMCCVTSVLWISADSMADSMGANPDFDVWEDMLKNVSKQGKNVSNQLAFIIINACTGYG